MKYFLMLYNLRTFCKNIMNFSIVNNCTYCWIKFVERNFKFPINIYMKCNCIAFCLQTEGSSLKSGSGPYLRSSNFRAAYGQISRKEMILFIQVSNFIFFIWNLYCDCFWCSALRSSFFLNFARSVIWNLNWIFSFFWFH